MATFYGSYVNSMYRARIEVSVTNNSNIQSTVKVDTYVEVATYYHENGDNFSGRANPGNGYGSWVAGADTYLSGPASLWLTSKSYVVNRTHAAQSINVAGQVQDTYLGWGMSTASGSVSVAARPSYAITYNANGGSSTPSSQTQWYGESVTLAGAITRANASATGYKVTYNANGGSCSTASSTAARTTKYTFSKWNTKSDGSGTAYSAGTAYTPNAALALYATWGSSTTTAAVTLPTPTRTGYTFNGWYNGSTKAGNAGASFTPNGNVTLTASWTQNSWTVSYAANGGSSTPASQTKKSGTALTLASAIGHANATATITTTFNANGGSATGATNNRLTSTRTTSYAFTKWKATNGTLYSAGGSYTTDAATTMTAQWSSSASYSAITLPTPTRTGYTFNGWYTAASGGSKAGNAGASHKPTADATLYAHWTIITHTVTLDPQGGSVSPASLTKTYGTALTLPTPYRSGYTFLGWNTAAAGTGTHYGTGSGGYTYDAGDRKLYAQWIGVSVSSFSVYRSDSAGKAVDDGTYARATANWSVGCTGTSNVTKTLTVKYLSGSTETTAGSTGTTGSYGITVGSGSTFSTDAAYRFTATATATWTYNGATRTVSATRVATLRKPFRLLDALHGGTGLAIGTVATLASTFEVALNAIFRACLRLRSSNVDRDGANPSSNTWGDSELSFQDTDGDRIGYVNVQRKTSGGVSLTISGEAEATDGTDVYESLELVANRDKTGYAALGGSYLSVRKVLSTARGVSYIAGANGDAALYAPKSTTNQYYPAVCLDTNGGGSWSIGNYNDETLCFVYATKANRDSNTNTVSIMKLNSGAGTIYTTTHKPSASDVGALPIGGGTLTGSLTLSSGGVTTTTAAHVIKDTRFNRDGSNPSDDVWSAVFGFQDKDGEYLGYLQAYQTTSGATGLNLYVIAENSSGGTYSNQIRLSVDKSGKKAYSVGDAAAFRSAIGAQPAGSYATTNASGKIQADTYALADRAFYIQGTANNSTSAVNGKAVSLFVKTSGLSYYDSSGTTNGWYVYGQRWLYANASGSNGTIPLNETAANFCMMEIFFKGNDGTFDSASVYSPNGKVVSLGMLESNANGGNNKKWRSVTISGTSITTKYYSEQDNAGTPTATNHIYICYVLGYYAQK